MRCQKQNTCAGPKTPHLDADEDPVHEGVRHLVGREAHALLAQQLMPQ